MNKKIDTMKMATGDENVVSSSLQQESVDEIAAKQSLDALASAALEASIHDHGFNDSTMEIDTDDNIDHIVSFFII